MPDADLADATQEAIVEAFKHRQPLAIHGANTKAFYGRAVDGRSLDVSGHRGVIHYEPSELVITARAGTPLQALEQYLADHDQMLPFEPPHFGTPATPGATLGGAIAAGLSGPRRPYAASARDTVLGVEIINGKGERLHFGGEVMKNVAGYDVARLMAGSMGTLGVILQASLKVLPRPPHELTLMQGLTPADAIACMNEWARRPLPISATYHEGSTLYVRLSGEEDALQAAARTIGGEPVDEDATLWRGIREQRRRFFTGGRPLWRLSLPPATPVLDLPDDSVMEWSGAQRWLAGDAPVEAVRTALEPVDGHATLFRGGDRQGQLFQPLTAVSARLHRHLKQAFDPCGILNPGRMYEGL